MNKICSRCNTPADVNAAFCQKCGSTEFTSYEKQSYGGYEQPQIQQEPIPPVYQQQFQVPINTQPQKKSSSALKIILIILGAIVLICVGMIIAFSFDDDSDVVVDDVETEYVESEEDEEKETESDEEETDTDSNKPTRPSVELKVEYTEGEIVDGAYYNEWANLYIPASSSLPIAEEVYFTTFENSTTDCGYVTMNMTTGTSGAVCFEDLSSQTAVKNAEDYIDLLESVTTTVYAEAIEISDERSVVTIAGEEYTTFTCTHSSGLLMRYYIRILDGYAVAIFASGVNEDAIDSFVDMISTVD